MKTTNKGKIISDEEFIELYNKGLSQAEICRQTGISSAQASRRCKKLNLDSKKNTKANYEKIDKDKFLNLYNNRNSDAEIARQFNCSESKIKNFRESLGLTIVDRKHFTDEEFLKIYNQNLSDKQIAEILNVSQGYVTQRRNKLSLPCYKEKKVIIPLTNIEFQVILGTVLGDTYLYKRYTHGDCAGTCNHCLEQEELIFTKYNYLKNISKEPRLINKYDERLQNPSYQQWYLYINSNPALNKIYNMFYKDKIKYINKELFEQIEPLGLAIWYMDDGTKPNQSGYLFCTQSFSNEDVVIIRDVLFNKFKLNTTKHKDNAIYITSNSKLAFKKLIEPYIVESMKYKL